MLNRMDRRSQLDCLKACGALLAEGAPVLFFPEGTRSKSGCAGRGQDTHNQSPAGISGKQQSTDILQGDAVFVFQSSSMPCNLVLCVCSIMAGFKKGAFSVAVKAGVDVVPVTLIGTGAGVGGKFLLWGEASTISSGPHVK